MAIQIVEQRTDDYRRELFKRMSFLAHDLITGHQHFRKDEELLLSIWREAFALRPDAPIEAITERLPGEFVADEDTPEEIVHGLPRALDYYLDRLCEKIVEHGAKEYLEPFGIRTKLYQAAVDIHDVTADIEYIHRTTGARIVLSDTYFSDAGEILQTYIVMRLH